MENNKPLPDANEDRQERLKPQSTDLGNEKEGGSFIKKCFFGQCIVDSGVSIRKDARGRED
jgi:hypothetical protein